MKRLLIAIVMTAALATPAGAQVTPQQQENERTVTLQAAGMTGDARKSFMSTCLSGGSAETKKPHCTNGCRAGTRASPRTRPAIQP